MKPEYGKIYIAEEITPVSEIIPGLFQGIRPGSYRGYDLVVSCEMFLAKGPMESFRGIVIHYPMLDDDDWHLDKRKIGIVAAAVASMVFLGGKVLVHCTGGLNRSSVVTAMALVELEYSRKDAVAILRGNRHSACLCNAAFERWVLDEPLPTAETTTFKPA